MKYATTVDGYLALDAIQRVESARRALTDVHFPTPDDIQQLHDSTLKSHDRVIDPKPYAVMKITAYFVYACSINLLKVCRSAVSFYDFDEYERLVTAARTIDHRTYLLVLLSGEAGLRSGEMVALEWTDVDLIKRSLCVQRNAWKGQVAAPKGGRIRYVPLTARLAVALREGRHLRGLRVLYRDTGQLFTGGAVTWAIVRAARRAGLEGNGPHRLRHTFCSHLAMRGAAPRAIQELAGHAHFTTTQRYMHLSPAALDHAISLLDEGRAAAKFGDILETASEPIANSSAVNS